MAKFPADGAAENDAALAGIVKLGAAGVDEVCKMLVPEGKGSDANAAEAAATQACSSKVTTLGGCDVKGTWCNDG